MHGLEVGAIVDSIVNSFGNSLDILNRLDGRNSSKKSSKTLLLAKDRRLHESLADGPERIKAYFRRNVELHGQRFKQGDTSAQTRLAQILLSFNTGLMEIINLALASTSRTNRLAKDRLLTLSDETTVDTMTAMALLEERLSTELNAPMSTQVSRKRKTPQRLSTNSQLKEGKPLKSTMDPAENPLLVRGGWVRSKTGSAVLVSAADARRRAARKVDKKQKLIPLPLASTRDESRYSEAETLKTPPLYEELVHGCHCELSRLTSQEDWRINPPLVHDFTHSKERPQSLYLVSAEMFRAREGAELTPPERPPKIPLHSRANPITRPRPPSAATFLTASTKIGEIPEDRLPDRMLSEEEQRCRPMPYEIPPPLFDAPKRKRRGFWLFKS